MTISPENAAGQGATAVVFDVEFTAWEGSMAARWLRPGEFKEIVQIGAVRVDAGFAPLERFDLLVRPRVNPVLSAYLEGVIGITNADITAHGVPFAEAYRQFTTFCGGLPLLAYGRDDLVLAQNLRLNDIEATVPPYTNIIGWALDQGIDVRKGHGCDVGPKAGVAFQGRPHNALDDAVSLAAGIAAVMATGAPSPLAPKPQHDPDADYILDMLELMPHPEGGAFRETFRDEPGPDNRARSTAIYFLLRAGEVSRRHRIDAAEVWHHYDGAPVELIIETTNGTETVILGTDLPAGQRPQQVVPAGAWQSARCLGGYSLVGCTVAPGFEFSRFEIVDRP
ncbi:MAG: cupin domain-containing protein [Rhizomicrobium sp.]